MAMARKKPRLATVPEVRYSVGEDAVDFMQISQEPDTPEMAARRRRTGSELSARPDVWGLASTWDRAGLAVIKLFDLSVHVYMLGLLSYTIFLNALVLLSEIPVLILSPADSSNLTAMFSPDPGPVLETWLTTNMSVLGKQRWAMSPAHLVLILTIFHVTYGLIAVICDIFFFRSLCQGLLTTKYMEIVLPVQRLFFLVITSMDGLIFTFTGNINTLMDDVFPTVMIVIICLLVFLDTFLVLRSFDAAKPGLVNSIPWRNLVMLVMLMTMTTHSLVTRYPTYTWDIGPMILFYVTGMLLCLKLIIPRLWRRSLEQGEVEISAAKVLDLLTCVSVANVIGLFSVASLSHRIVFHYFDQARVYL